MSPKTRRVLMILAGVLLAVVVIAFAIVRHLIVTPYKGYSAPRTAVTIPPGSSVNMIAKMLNKKGDTATYLQYAFARVCGIFRKGGFDRNVCRTKGGRIELEHPAERALALQIVRFSEALDDSAAECRPNFLTNYLFETANCFSTFFEQCPVLKAESASARISRLLLADLTARVLAQGLELLGIQTIEQM